MKIEKTEFIDGLKIIGLGLGFVVAIMLPGKLISGEEINAGSWACNIIVATCIFLLAILERNIKPALLIIFILLVISSSFYGASIFLEIINHGWGYLFSRIGVIFLGLISVAIFSAIMCYILKEKKLKLE